MLEVGGYYDAEDLAGPDLEVPGIVVTAPDDETAQRWLARAAGYGDTETWWDHLVEQRGDSLDLFAAIAEMMTALRND